MDVERARSKLLLVIAFLPDEYFFICLCIGPKWAMLSCTYCVRWPPVMTGYVDNNNNRYAPLFWIFGIVTIWHVLPAFYGEGIGVLCLKRSLEIRDKSWQFKWILLVTKLRGIQINNWSLAQMLLLCLKVLIC